MIEYFFIKSQAIEVRQMKIDEDKKLQTCLKTTIILRDIFSKILHKIYLTHPS